MACTTLVTLKRISMGFQWTWKIALEGSITAARGCGGVVHVTPLRECSVVCTPVEGSYFLFLGVQWIRGH